MPFKPSVGSIFGTALAFGGGGLGVILTKGQTTWVPQNQWLAPALFSIGGALVMWAGWLVLKSRTRESSSPDKNERQMVRSDTNGPGSPALSAGRDIRITYGTSSGTPSPDSNVVSEARPTDVVASPNLAYVGSREKRVFISPFAQEGVCDPHNSKERDKSVQALILRFENKIAGDRKVARAMNLVAKIRFRSSNGVRERAINYGVWLNSPCNCTDLEVGDTEELVLACVMESSLVALDDRRSENHSFHSEFSYIEDGIVDGLETVEVTLIDKKTQCSLNLKLRVWRDGLAFCVAEA